MKINKEKRKNRDEKEGIIKIGKEGIKQNKYANKETQGRDEDKDGKGNQGKTRQQR